MSSDYKTLLKILFDLIFVLISSYISICIFSGALIPISKSFFLFSIVISATIIPSNYYFKTYFAISKYFNTRNVINIIFATLMSFVVQIFFIFILKFLNLNFTKTILIFFSYQNIFLVHFFIFLFTLNFRLALRISVNFSDLTKRNNLKNQCLIYGAGNDGVSAIKFITDNKGFNPIGFIDDDVNKIGRYIDNLPIISFNLIEEYISEKKVKKVFICLPSASSFKIDAIIRKLKFQKIEYEELKSPDSNNIIKGLDFSEIKKNIINSKANGKKNTIYKNKKILITGAAGTIGEELCYQLLNEQPSELILVDSSEIGISNLTQKLDGLNKDTKVKISINLVNLCLPYVSEKIILKYKPNFIFHAAAYKHVEIVEENPVTSVYNNLSSLINLLEASSKLNNINFVFISTDKAVEPVNYMGKSKRLGEIITSSFNKISLNSNKYCSVRFGNVIGSSGSLIPKIQNQINNNDDITITDKKATRYFMTISDAINLTLQSINLTQEGEIFVLNMGDPINIFDLVSKIIKNSGRNNLIGKIKITGLRKGEKLHEKLYNKEISQQSENKLFFIEKIQKSLSVIEIDNLKKNLDKSLELDDVNSINKIFNLL